MNNRINLNGRMLLLACAVVAMLSASAAVAQEVPFAGMVTDDEVEVRAGAGTSYYVVGKLKKGTAINVDDRIFEWYKITPPPGVFSYASKGHINARGDGTEGVISVDRARVTAASVNGPGESYRRQLDLLKGDKVQIVAEEGGFYKIIPPKEAYVFLPVKSVTKAQFQPAVAAAPPAAPAAAPAAPAVAVAVPAPTPVVVEPVEPVAVAPAPTPAPVVTTPEPAPAPAPVAVTVKPVEPPAPVAVSTQPAPPPLPSNIGEGSRPLPEVVPPSVVTVEPAAPTNSAAVLNPGPLALDPHAPAATVQVRDPALPASPAVSTEPADATGHESIATASDAPVAMPAEPPQPQFNARTEAVRAVEEKMIAAMQLPLERRPVDELLSAYELVARDQSLPIGDKRIVAIRLAQLRRDAQLAVALRQIAAVQQQAETTMPPPVNVTRTSRDYDAFGVMVASVVYDGVNLPRLYRVVNPVDNRTLAYIRPNAAVDAANQIGRTVGVLGATQYDPGLKLRVLDPERVDVIESQPAVVN